MDFLFDFGFYGVLAVFLVALLASAIKILREYERAVVFTPGRFTRVIPANAFLDASGLSWNCDRGYRKQADACALIEVLENAHLTDRGIGAGWECDRGHVAQAGACVPIDILENAYATNAGSGAAWRCEQGFVQTDGRCDPVAVPADSFLDDRAHGPGWRCARVFEARKTSCVMIDLPENAHLDRSGNRWQCNRGFPAFGGQPMHPHTLRAPTRQRGAGRIGSC